MCSAFPPRFRLPLSINYDDIERDKLNKAERFLIGIFRYLDKRQTSRGGCYWLRDLAYWTLSGWYAIFNMVQESNGETEFLADFWDPLTVYPEWDSDGLRKCVRKYEVDKKTALSMLSDFEIKGATKLFVPEANSNSMIEVVDYWRRVKQKRGKNKVYNAVFIGGHPVKQLREEPFDHIPIQIGAIGVPEKSSPDWKSRWGENIITASRDVIDYENAIVSLTATIMAETAYPNIVSQTQSGRPAFDAKQLRGYGSQINIRTNEKIELLKHAATPAEALQLLAWAKSQKQKSMFPDVVYGGIPMELSGFAISQLMAAIRYRVGPYLTTMMQILSNVATDFLVQYKNGNFPEVNLSTVNRQELKKGMFFIEKFNKDDVPETIFVDAVIPLTSSLDKTQLMLMAR